MFLSVVDIQSAINVHIAGVYMVLTLGGNSWLNGWGRKSKAVGKKNLCGDLHWRKTKSKGKKKVEKEIWKNSIILFSFHQINFTII